MLTKRTNILFDEKLWGALVELSKRTDTSVGQLVRTAVEEKYVDKERERLERIRKACEHIEKIRKRFKGTIDYKALINYGRRI